MGNTDFKDLQNKYAFITNKPITDSSKMLDNICFDICEIDDIVMDTATEHMDKIKLANIDLTHHKSLEKKLRSFAGEIMIYDVDDYISNVLESGQLWYGEKVYCLEMKQNNCHDNIITFVEEEPEYPIVVGYALSEYGFWYAHTWSLELEDNGAIVIESTKPALLYYGIVLSDKEKADFKLKYKLT